MREFVRCGACGNPIESGEQAGTPGPCPWCRASLGGEGGPRPDARFGKYWLQEKLGEGGMGEVWKGLDSELNRPVAIKFLKSKDSQELARFRREAMTAAQLAHPNIAAIYEMSEDRGLPFIAMQYVPGRMIGLVPRKDRSLIVRLMAEAARAVDHAHRQGIIHRDLKPENLMVDNSHDGARVVVLDFGLARPVQGGERLSVSGDIVGTPAYMSPEQARGESLDPRTDVYSLGATLYELVTGKPPFEADSVFEVIRRVATDEPVRPRRIDAGIHRDLETIILKCLEKDPARRYDSAGRLAEDLERFLNLVPIVARPPSLIYRINLAFARRKAVVVAAGIGVVVALGLVWRLTEVSRRDREGRAAAARREVVLKEVGTLWSRMVEAKQGLHIQPVDYQKEVPRVRHRILDVMKDVGAFIDRNPELPQGLYIRARGWIYLEDFDAAERDLRRALRTDNAFQPGRAQLGRLLLQRSILLQMEEYKEILVTAPTLGSSSEESVRALLQEAQAELALAKGASHSKESWGLTWTREDEVSDVLIRALVMRYVDHRAAEAVQMLTAANDQDPSEEYMNWLGKWEKEPEAGMAWQARAISRRPIFGVAYYDRACGHARRAVHTLEEDPAASGAATLDRFRPFAADAEMALLISPAFSRLRLVLAVLCQAEGNVSEAIRHMDRAIEESSGSSHGTDYLSLRATLKIASKDYPGAIEDLSRVLDAAPAYSSARTLRSIASWLNGDSEASQRDFELELTMGRITPAHYFLERGRYCESAGKLDEAQADLERAVRESRTDEERKSSTAALNGIKSRRERADFNPALLFRRSFARHQAKDYRAAIDGFRQIVEAVPDHVLAKTSAYNAACGHALLGETETAWEWLERAVDLGFRDVDYLEKDADLESLRSDKRYAELLNRIRSK